MDCRISSRAYLVEGFVDATNRRARILLANGIAASSYNIVSARLESYLLGLARISYLSDPNIVRGSRVCCTHDFRRPYAGGHGVPTRYIVRLLDMHQRAAVISTALTERLRFLNGISGNAGFAAEGALWRARIHPPQQILMFLYLRYDNARLAKFEALAAVGGASCSSASGDAAITSSYKWTRPARYVAMYSFLMDIYS